MIAALDRPGATRATMVPVRVEGLRKTYGSVVAVDDVSLEVAAGEAIGLLGPNGAGKTTTVKALVGLVRPTAGLVEVFGRSARDPAARTRLGYLPELFRFPEWLTGREVLDFHARLAGLAPEARRRRVGEVLEQVGLEGRGAERVKGYSKGMSQRLGLAQALLGHPDLVLLDEPTSALDPLGRRLVRDVIRELLATGTAVLLNSHLLTEVETVCRHVVVLDRGSVRWSGPWQALVRSVTDLRIHARPRDAGLLALLEPFGTLTEDSPENLVLRVEGDDLAPAVAAAIVGAGYRLYGLSTTQRTLEDLYVQLVSESDQ